MPKLPAQTELAGMQRLVAQRPELGHIRTRARGDTLILESGPPDDPTRHARLRRDTIHLWYLEMPGRGGRWEPTGIRGTRIELLEALVGQFPWMMMDHGAEPAAN